jgi:hypothetical protein
MMKTTGRKMQKVVLPCGGYRLVAFVLLSVFGASVFLGGGGGAGARR